MPQHKTDSASYRSRGDWYEIRAFAGDKPAEVLIYGDIGESWDAESVTAKQFVDDLADIDAASMVVRINSYGGSVTDAMAIYNAIRRHKAQVTVEIDGAAYSAASMIAQAGDTLTMAENALMMIHAPWNIAIGNAQELRDQADTLDRYAKAMATSYARNDFTADDALALLSDGEDHWYTADEAFGLGLIDEIGPRLAVAASAQRNRFNNPQPPKAAPQQEADMPTKEKPQAAPEQPAEDPVNVTEIETKAREKALAETAERNKRIRAMFKVHMSTDGARDLLDEIIDDTSIDEAQAGQRLLSLIGAQNKPIGGAAPATATAGIDEKDKFRSGAKAALAARMGLDKVDTANEFRGFSLAQMAEKSLAMAGVRTAGMTRSEIASKVLASHSSSDFPYLLQDAANKRLQAAYENFPSTWNQWCATGEVVDFKTVNLIRMGSFNSLETIAEGDEYQSGTVGEEREQLTAATKGRFIRLTRQMIINDDLQGFSRMAALLGRAAARTVNKDVYTLLTSNPTMSDSVDLFHADHGNLAGTGAAPTVATLGAGRAAMRKQQDPNDNDYLNIMPSVIMCPVALEDTMNVLVTSESDPAKSNSRTANPVRNMATVVSDPYLDANSATAWYLAAAPMDAPLMEVHFLDGNQSPYIDSEEEFLTDAVQWKVRLDYGVAANDYRGGWRNAGA